MREPKFVVGDLITHRDFGLEGIVTKVVSYENTMAGYKIWYAITWSTDASGMSNQDPEEHLDFVDGLEKILDRL